MCECAWKSKNLVSVEEHMILGIAIAACHEGALPVCLMADESQN